MQSAFVDIGLERDGFLYVSDVVATLEEFESSKPRTRTTTAGAGSGQRPEGPGGEGHAQGGYRRQERGRRGQGRRARRPGRDREEPRIEELLNEGQEIIVQVAEGAARHEGRPAHVTRVAGRAASWCSCRPSTTSASRARSTRATSARRLRGIVREFREQHGFTGGIIIRTAASGRPKEDISRDLQYFNQIWTEIRQQDRLDARARRRLPRAEPRRQAAARPADRRIHRRSASTTTVEHQRVVAARRAHHAARSRRR